MIAVAVRMRGAGWKTVLVYPSQVEDGSAFMHTDLDMSSYNRFIADLSAEAGMLRARAKGWRP